MLKQGLSQKMLQKLSPQQIQLMKLLQIPTATLDQRIKEELEANPALEEGEDIDPFEKDAAAEEGERAEEEYESFELDDYINDYLEDDPSSYKMRLDKSTDEEERQVPLVVENTFHDYLESQLGLLDFESESDFQIGLQVIGSIDEDGYLRRDLDAIIDDLMFTQNIMTTREKLEDMLTRIQHFDPAGVGARDLQESLLLQLDAKLRFVQEPSICLARTLIGKYFEEFSKKHYEKLKRQLQLNDQQLKDAIQEIVKLNPRPATGFSNSSMRSSTYIVPDFIITNRDGELELNLNSRNAPDLKINDQYKSILQNFKISHSNQRVSKKDRDAIMFIKQKIDSAKWFIDAIRKRQQTMYKTMYTILQFQYDFFLTGDPMKLKPMILKDIAELTDLDISTVSRVANSKFVQTEFGTKKLKEFFSESMQTQSGEEVSTLEVKNILTEIIHAEDKRKPYSDEKLKNMLTNKGYNIARRTVAKYREQLNLPVARLRKQL